MRTTRPRGALCRSMLSPPVIPPTRMVQLQEANALSPYMFTRHVTKNHFQKSSQWVSLTRAAAYLAVHDRIVEPWFATFGGAHWRCRFIEEGALVLDGCRGAAGRGRARGERQQLGRACSCAAAATCLPTSPPVRCA